MAGGTLIRLQVFLSRQGVCSRRKAMTLVQEGSVAVNGQVVTEPSTPVDPDRDRIAVNGRRVRTQQHTYVLLNKPKGYVTTKTAQFGQKTAFDLLPKHLHRLHSVGRLDKDTEGLLLLTNDGDLTYKLTHPKFHLDKVYLVKILGTLRKTEQGKLEKGVVIEGKKTAPARIRSIKRRADTTEFLMTIHEGRKRQVRLMLAHVRHKVVYLKRVAHGPLQLNDLPGGKFRPLTDQEIRRLKDLP